MKPGRFLSCPAWEEPGFKYLDPGLSETFFFSYKWFILGDRDEIDIFRFRKLLETAGTHFDLHQNWQPRELRRPRYSIKICLSKKLRLSDLGMNTSII